MFDERTETDVLVSKYGAHLFHTNNERVWRFVTRFSEWTQYEHRVAGWCVCLF